MFINSFQQNQKLASEADYPYKTKDNACAADDTTKDNAFTKLQFVPMSSSNNKVYRWYSDKSSTTKTDANGTTYQVLGESTAQFVATNFSVSVSLMAESAFQSYKKGIFNTASASTSINHAVTLYGYTQEYFDLQNSWGVWWGVDGCMTISRRHGNLIQIMSYNMYPRVECTFGTNPAGYCKNSGGGEGCMCYNGGLCKLDGTCLCKTGWGGEKCQEKDQDGCKCENGGVCVAEGCKCPVKWQGEFCEEEDTCGCKNGKCVQTTGTCECHEGWGGDSGKCDESDEQGCGCKNGGVCNIKGGCDCPEEFSGDKCEYKTCGCENGGICSDDGTCDCSNTDYTGDKCDEKKEKACDKNCRAPKECYWKREDKMRCRCPKGTYGGRECLGTADCTQQDVKACARLIKKDEDKFWAKCEKPWGVKKCPHSCGFCKD